MVGFYHPPGRPGYNHLIHFGGFRILKVVNFEHQGAKKKKQFCYCPLANTYSIICKCVAGFAFLVFSIAIAVNNGSDTADGNPTKLPNAMFGQELANQTLYKGI